MRVNIAHGSTDKPHSFNVDLRDCYPDDEEGYQAARIALEQSGRYTEGGGAAATSYLFRVDALPVAAAAFLHEHAAFEAGCDTLENMPSDLPMAQSIECMRGASFGAEVGPLRYAVAEYLKIWDSLETDGPCPADAEIAAIRAALE